MMKRLLSILLAVLTLNLFVPLTASAQTITELDYVSLGDSLAAGQTPFGATSGYGYSDILADRLEEEGVLGTYTKDGTSGLRTSTLLLRLATNPTLLYKLSQAEIVTLNIGANDLLAIAIWDQRGRSTTYPGNVNPALVTGLSLEAIIGMELQYIGSAIVGIISAIADLPGATPEIYVMGYYDAIPEIPQVRGMIEQLNTVISGAASFTGATYVPVMNAFDKHLYRYLPYQSDYPYQPLINRDIHPTVQGYRAIAQCFWSPIQKDFLR